MNSASTIREKAQIESLIFSLQSEPTNIHTALADIIKVLKETNITLLNYVGVLEPYLTSQEASKRVIGMQALVKIIEPLTIRELNPSTAKVLVDFLILRTSDAVSISPILDGMWALLNLEGISSSLKATIINGLLDHIHVQSFQYNIRNLSFQILEKGLGFIDEKTVRPAFILKVVDAVDGEKDPRNLSLIFDIIIRLIRNFDISGCYKDVFNSVYSYFPITYRPNSIDSERSIVANLKNKLNTCLTESPLFGQLVLAKLVDKLAETSPAVKEDIYKVLAAGVPVYPYDLWNSLFSKILRAVYTQLFSEMNDQVEQYALGFLSALALLPAQSGNLSYPNQYTINEISDVINSLDLKKSDVSQKIISAVCNSSKKNCDDVSKPLVYAALEKFDSAISDSQQVLLMELLASLTESCAKHNSTVHLTEKRDELLSIFSINALFPCNTESSQKVIAQISGISALIEASSVLSSNEIELGFMTLCKALLDQNQDPHIRLAALVKVKHLAPNSAEHINNIIINDIFAELNSTPVNSHDLDAINRIHFLYGCLETFSELKPGFFNYIRDLIFTKFKFTPDSSSEMMSLIKNIVSQQVKDSYQLVNIDSSFMKRLAVLFLSSEEIDQNSAMEIAEIISLVFREMDQSSQTESLQDWADVLGAYVTKPKVQRHDSAYVFLSAIVCSYRQNVPLGLLKPLLTDPLNDDDPNSAISKAVHSTSQSIRLSCSQIVASILNKSQHGVARSAVSNRIKAAIEPINAALLDLALWVSKALICRGDALGYELVDRILDLMGHSATESGKNGNQALNLGIITQPHPWAINRQCHFTVQPLYKQRFYLHILPKIASMYNDSTPDIQSNLLVSFIGVIKDTPISVIAVDVKSVAPLLTDAIVHPNSALKEIGIKSLKEILVKSSNRTQDFLFILETIPAMLNSLGIAPRSQSIGVRIATLEFISLLADTFDFIRLAKYQKTVILRLQNSLDDPKRVVRKLTIVAKHKWDNLGA